ncbi:MAG TPA: tail fiber protein [Verrucomicrobiae bacterium]|nr:tail fiber protein [Verrucomicrobiae bacterium]
MASPFLGEIRVFPYNFAPRGWAFCNGQILPISQNTALFSLLGTQYGGNGTSNFALPNLQGNVAIGQGSGPGLTPRTVGEVGGTQTVTLATTQMPAHNHLFACNSKNGNSYSPAGNIPAVDAGGNNLYSPGPPDSHMNAGHLPVQGSGLPHNNMQPYLTLSYCIAMQGIFPARN